MYGMFFDTYDTPVYRPPSEAASFILRVTRFLQLVVQSTMAISGVSMQRIGINCRADFVLRILRSALMWMSKKQAKDLR
mgnify:CR=1 FL=1